MKENYWKELNSKQINDIMAQFFGNCISWKVLKMNLERNKNVLDNIKKDHERINIFAKKFEEEITDVIEGFWADNEVFRKYEVNHCEVSISVQ
jgi:hypothetical protein